MKAFVALLWVLLFVVPIIGAVVEKPGFAFALVGLFAFILGVLRLSEKITER